MVRLIAKVIKIGLMPVILMKAEYEFRFSLKFISLWIIYKTSNLPMYKKKRKKNLCYKEHVFEAKEYLFLKNM